MINGNNNNGDDNDDDAHVVIENLENNADAVTSK